MPNSKIITRLKNYQITLKIGLEIHKIQMEIRDTAQKHPKNEIALVKSQPLVVFTSFYVFGAKNCITVYSKQTIKTIDHEQ